MIVCLRKHKKYMDIILIWDNKSYNCLKLPYLNVSLFRNIILHDTMVAHNLPQQFITLLLGPLAVGKWPEPPLPLSMHMNFLGLLPIHHTWLRVLCVPLRRLRILQGSQPPEVEKQGLMVHPVPSHLVQSDQS